MATDHELRVHRDWIGLLQPVGLVVSPPALLAAQAFPDKNIIGQQQALLALVTPIPPSAEARRSLLPPLPLSFASLATEVLGWRPSRLVGLPGQSPLPDTLDVVLPEFGETLRPTYAVQGLPEDVAPVRGSVPPGAADHWMILIQELAPGTSLDDAAAEDDRAWHASPQARLERLLRETAVPIGILCDGHFIRLVYAPRGESSGHITWPVHRLGTALDRDMLSALVMLLGNARLFTNPHAQRLPHILKESRKYQNVVSTKLAGQVLEALNELLRGFQSANEAAKGGLLDATVREEPDHVYGGLLAVLLRLVFILYAEERGLLSSSAAYVRNYSLVGLFDKLRVDAGRFPDTMDQRYGAWSRLLVLFRMVHDGAKRGDLRLPPRYGHLFDPDGWAFLEGRSLRVNRTMGAPLEVPKVPDGVVLRVLEKLLLLDSDRLSYRALDVEQIGSVYENMMGFRLERAVETSIGVGKQHVVVGLETLLAKNGADREKFLKETASVEVTGKAAEALKAAATVDELVAALSRRISPLTPRMVPAGGLYLQPTDERRRSGSHYTPRELTDSLVGLTREQIASFHWAPEKQIPVIRTFVDKAIAEAMALRAKIPNLANSDDVQEKRQLLRDADNALAKVRMVGDAIVASFFSEENPNMAFAMMPAEWIYSQKAILFAIDGYGGFSVIQSRVHELWARFFSSTSMELTSYTPSDCFETFPFPTGYAQNASLERKGREYDEARSAFMRESAVGLTETYNRFHNPDIVGNDVVALRESHAAMDRAVLDAYGWTDIRPTWEFLLDYEEEEDDADVSGGRRKKRPWRYRWPDEVRDEVLGRLLELNARRAKEEAGTPPPPSPGTPSASGKKPRGRAKRTKKAVPSGQGGLFDEGNNE